MRASLHWLILAAAIVGTPTSAQKNEPFQGNRPPVFEELFNCRAIANADERLACYDTKVAAIDTAEKNDELVIADKESMKQARRGLFGFSLPKLKLFGNEGKENEESEIVAKIDSAYQTSSGRWNIVLEDGARWSQIDTDQINKYPVKGMEIKIRKAAMGSFFANIAGQRAIRMKRVN